MLVDHVLSGFGGRTAAQAIEDGIDPRDVWRALCADFDVPAQRVVTGSEPTSRGVDDVQAQLSRCRECLALVVPDGTARPVPVR